MIPYPEKTDGKKREPLAICVPRWLYTRREESSIYSIDGIIFLYIAVKDENIDVEVAFN